MDDCRRREEYIMGDRRGKLGILIWMVAVAGMLFGMSGCDFIDILEFAGLMRIRNVYSIGVHVSSSLNNRPVPGAKVYLRANVYSRKTKSKISNTDLLKDKITDELGRTWPWEFEYELLYDKEEGEYLEYIRVDIFAIQSDPAPGGAGVGVVRALNSGYITMYPHQGVYGSIRLSSSRGIYNTKIIAWLPLKAHSRQ